MNSQHRLRCAMSVTSAQRAAAAQGPAFRVVLPTRRYPMVSAGRRRVRRAVPTTTACQWPVAREYAVVKGDAMEGRHATPTPTANQRFAAKGYAAVHPKGVAQVKHATPTPTAHQRFAAMECAALLEGVPQGTLVTPIPTAALAQEQDRAGLECAWPRTATLATQMPCA